MFQANCFVGCSSDRGCNQMNISQRILRCDGLHNNLTDNNDFTSCSRLALSLLYSNNFGRHTGLQQEQCIKSCQGPGTL